MDWPTRLHSEVYSKCGSGHAAALEWVLARVEERCPSAAVRSTARYSALYVDGGSAGATLIAYIEPRRDGVLFGLFADDIRAAPGAEAIGLRIEHFPDWNSARGGLRGIRVLGNDTQLVELLVTAYGRRGGGRGSGSRISPAEVPCPKATGPVAAQREPDHSRHPLARLSSVVSPSVLPQSAGESSPLSEAPNQKSGAHVCSNPTCTPGNAGHVLGERGDQCLVPVSEAPQVDIVTGHQSPVSYSDAVGPSDAHSEVSENAGIGAVRAVSVYGGIRAALTDLYLTDPRPWLVGFSGGKDSASGRK